MSTESEQTSVARIELLGQLYSELRSYRGKEFQTFIFAFPIIGSGYLTAFANMNRIIILLSIFSLLVVIYIWFNHFRMMKIKKEIVNFQKLLDLNADFRFLDPYGWIDKETWWHLGTVLYTLVLVAEAVMLWW